MKDFDTYNNLSLDTKEAQLIDIKTKKDENDPIKSDDSTNNSSFSDSMEQMDSLIVKEKPVINQYSNIKTKDRKGNTLMFFFDENGSPKIVIGPHCKKRY